MRKPRSLDLPLEDQTIEQLQLAREYWEEWVTKAETGAASSAAWGFMRGCDNMIIRKQEKMERETATLVGRNQNRKREALI